ncbi:DUF6421 family protein [Streptomyces sp. MA5143a]|uniref:DUF6421 family protein n=1 Tax=Streptomyces sp. MA5143a TaxID=2083010 RepID=UPI000D1AE2D9|nr:DUF6421 family protein [Streptomyces sp. MA5143a]SPF07044.1 hypothetical protein SMA5143A_7888 [Streptomyces sp. MA5143a]
MTGPDSSWPAVEESVVKDPAWAVLKGAVEALRSWQAKDGSIAFHAEGAPSRDEVRSAVVTVIGALGELTPRLPHDADYHRALAADLRHWADGGFSRPDFLDSLLAFTPADERRDGREHLVLFPMRSQNAAAEIRFEAVIVSLVWPPWLAELERTRFDNPVFVSVALEDYTPGYAGNNATLFPETVAVRATPGHFTWGGLFCDREAARFRLVAAEAARVLRFDVPAEAAGLLADQRLAEQTFAAWDLVHDRAHSRGSLPFDPFMIKQRAPYWMYGLEELRCDLTAFSAAVDLATEADVGTRAFGPRIQYAVLFERLFRFPLTGDRVRNYDSLAGQLLFARLRRHGAMRWMDNAISFDWDRVPEAVALLRDDIEVLYHDGVDRPRPIQWWAAFQFIAESIPPHPGSIWAKGPDALDFSRPRREMVDATMPDEFPLSIFYENLKKQLGGVIAASSGLSRAYDGATRIEGGMPS